MVAFPPPSRTELVLATVARESSLHPIKNRFMVAFPPPSRTELALATVESTPNKKPIYGRIPTSVRTELALATVAPRVESSPNKKSIFGRIPTSVPDGVGVGDSGTDCWRRVNSRFASPRRGVPSVFFPKWPLGCLITLMVHFGGVIYFNCIGGKNVQLKFLLKALIPLLTL